MSLRVVARLFVISFLAGLLGVFGLMFFAFLAVEVQPFFEPTEPVLPWVALTPLELTVLGVLASSAFAVAYALYVRLRTHADKQES